MNYLWFVKHGEYTAFLVHLPSPVLDVACTPGPKSADTRKLLWNKPSYVPLSGRPCTKASSHSRDTCLSRQRMTFRKLLVFRTPKPIFMPRIEQKSALIMAALFATIATPGRISSYVLEAIPRALWAGHIIRNTSKHRVRSAFPSLSARCRLGTILSGMPHPFADEQSIHYAGVQS